MDKGYFMLRVTNINRATKNIVASNISYIVLMKHYIVNVQMKKLSFEIILLSLKP
jgi:hypothetical protein